MKKQTKKQANKNNKNKTKQRQDEREISAIMGSKGFLSRILKIMKPICSLESWLSG